MKPADIIPLIDLTQLPDQHGDTKLAQLIATATTPLGPVAAICVYPEFIPQIKLPAKTFQLATVCNFPHGTNSLQQSLEEISQAISDGADEIDLVMPYRQFLNGDMEYCQTYLQACRDACMNKKLKVIIESGELATTSLIKEATQLVVKTKADFVKTSTGKTSTGATLNAVTAILQVLQQHPSSQVGLKISGGIGDYTTACQYTQLVENHMGTNWINPSNFRLGASRLLQDILVEASRTTENE